MQNITVQSYYVNQKPRGSDTEEETKPLKAEETGAGATSTSTEGETNTYYRSWTIQHNKVQCNERKLTEIMSHNCQCFRYSFLLRI